jgi:hypothetical protein
MLVFLKTMASYNPTSLTPSLFTEVPLSIWIFNSNPQFWEKFQPVLRSQSSIVPPCNISFGGPVAGTSS